MLGQIPNPQLIDGQKISLEGHEAQVLVTDVQHDLSYRLKIDMTTELPV